MGLLPRAGKFFDLFNRHADLAAGRGRDDGVSGCARVRVVARAAPAVTRRAQ
jgi:hypothetical protein